MELETEVLIEHLRKMGAGKDSNPNYYIMAADRLEDLRDSVDVWIKTFDMLNDRENRHHYLDYWREKNGYDSLWYPDGDEVYKDFFDMKARAELFEEVCGRLTKENEKLREMDSPCRMGAVAYSVFDLEEDGNWVIQAYVVEGVGRIGNEWYVYNDGMWYEVGCDWCLLSREEAERVLAERRKQ